MRKRKWLIYKHLIHHQAEPEPLSNVRFSYRILECVPQVQSLSISEAYWIESLKTLFPHGLRLNSSLPV